ncbi:hypothetical protein CHARACLAT_018462, partial [Characodon lateralis]|nr:hypothetical protein [Characodon lateralis]
HEGREGGDGLTISSHQALRQLCGAAAVHKTCAKPRSGGPQRSAFVRILLRCFLSGFKVTGNSALRGGFPQQVI